jgi:uncharacterized membrane protein YsdA (DUF1294 family)
MDMRKYILIAIALWNLTVLFMYAMDKYRAKSGGWRVPERTLIVCALCLGGIGAAAGMGLLRHKTRHLKFRVVIHFSLLITVAAAVFVLRPEAVAEILSAITQGGTPVG